MNLVTNARRTRFLIVSTSHSALLVNFRMRCVPSSFLDHFLTVLQFCSHFLLSDDVSLIIRAVILPFAIIDEASV